MKRVINLGMLGITMVLLWNQELTATDKENPSSGQVTIHHMTEVQFVAALLLGAFVEIHPAVKVAHEQSMANRLFLGAPRFFSETDFVMRLGPINVDERERMARLGLEIKEEILLSKCRIRAYTRVDNSFVAISEQAVVEYFLGTTNRLDNADGVLMGLSPNAFPAREILQNSFQRHVFPRSEVDFYSKTQRDALIAVRENSNVVGLIAGWAHNDNAVGEIPIIKGDGTKSDISAPLMLYRLSDTSTSKQFLEFVLSKDGYRKVIGDSVLGNISLIEESPNPTGKLDTPEN